MSWQDHVTSLLGSGFVESAIIIDLESQQIVAWDGPLAHNPGNNIQNEVVDLIKALAQPSLAQGKGITLGGNKYFCIRAEDGLIYGKLGAGGLCAARTNKVVILGVYGEGIPPPKHNQTIEMFRDNFLQHGY